MEGEEETAIAAYIVSDGVDACRVGFLKRQLVKHWKMYECVLVQVTEVYSTNSVSRTKRRLYPHNIGCCVASIISGPAPESKKRNAEDAEQSAQKNVARSKL